MTFRNFHSISPHCQRKSLTASAIYPQRRRLKKVFSIDKDSVAGPDGFSLAFYQACWEFIAKDIHEAVRDFFCGTPMLRSFKTTTIVLIPKGLPPDLERL
ncbi:UNVERIFIED_CONTAM: hypothetical protein Sangu_2773100 [Sesamum angustifolium]|uniref:Reverse transcriptase n=1 Tax=Sesamum angustifolium TaxID=2727405 RepID=A0AAW2IU03_9LAMI